MGAMLCARVSKSIAGMARSYNVGGQGPPRGFMLDRLRQRAWSAPWARCSGSAL
jgi:hypothetical protein